MYSYLQSGSFESFLVPDLQLNSYTRRRKSKYSSFISKGEIQVKCVVLLMSGKKLSTSNGKG